GEATQTITVSDPGEYCVVVTDASGCESEACTYFFPFNPDTCGLVIFPLPFGGDSLTFLFAIPLNMDLEGDFLWNTGDTTPYVLINGLGEFCVTYSNDSCTVTECINVDDINPLVIYGGVDGPVNINSTDVALVQMHNDQFAVQDHSGLYGNPIGEGMMYGFNNIEAGNYLVLADGQSVGNGAPLLPTYNGNVLFWDEATLIEAHQGSHEANIELIEGIQTRGPGAISGYVEEGLGGIILNNSRGVDNPLPNASMILLDGVGRPVNHDPSDVTGAFDFGNLPYGRYELHINIPGINREMVEINLTPENPSIENIIFSVNGNEVTTGIEDLLDAEDVNIFPNPFSNEIQISFEVKTSADARLSIVDINGKEVMNQTLRLNQGTYNESFDLSNLANGLYMMNIVYDGEVLSKRIIKQ
ncbi:MAG: T9SS type A sorting domain-containing protein, partial [Bacteroidota bacterium]